MASGALSRQRSLPFALPTIYIGVGGILSNTPLEAIFDDNPRRSALIFSVHVWIQGRSRPLLGHVLTREEGLRFASRSQNQIMRQKQLHKLRRVITELVDNIPEHARGIATVRELAAYGCVTQMHVVSLQAPMLDLEDHLKDIDFSGVSIRRRWEAGYAHTCKAIEQDPDGSAGRSVGRCYPPSLSTNS